MVNRGPALDRILSKCELVPALDHPELVGECWVYTGVLAPKGYVRVRADGANRRKVYGHRVTWEYFIEPIPDGLTFDHLCRNTSCVNPWHGDLVPSLVNSRRSSRNIAVVNASKTHCPQGHPLEGDNIKFNKTVQGTRARQCRICHNEANRAYRLRIKTAAA